MQRSVTLKQTNSKNYYRVVSMVNYLGHSIGDVLKKDEVNDLIVSKIKVTIK